VEVVVIVTVSPTRRDANDDPVGAEMSTRPARTLTALVVCATNSSSVDVLIVVGLAVGLMIGIVVGLMVVLVVGLMIGIVVGLMVVLVVGLVALFT
jgi:hypothetical protein